ncbi:MAG: hypothetical protein QXU11_11795 [Thermoproteota archaeon]
MFEFYPVWSDIKEYEPKRHIIVINSSIVVDKMEITLQSNNSKIRVKPATIEIEETAAKEGFIIKQIELYSEEAGIIGEVIATSDNLNHSSKMGVRVLENPIFSPENGFAFVPGKITIVDGGEKKVLLCIDKNVIETSKEIRISSEEPINSPGTWLLPDPKNIDKNMIKNIVVLEIPIKVKGTDHIGEKATVTAKYEDKMSELHVDIVPEPSIAGAIRDIRLL